MVREYIYTIIARDDIHKLAKKASWELACIEIKLSNAPVISRGFYNCIEDLGTTQNFVITPSSDTYPHKNSLVCSLIEFLKKYLGEID